MSIHFFAATQQNFHDANPDPCCDEDVVFKKRKSMRVCMKNIQGWNVSAPQKNGEAAYAPLFPKTAGTNDQTTVARLM
jgi:hypothetical protein